MGSNPWAVHSIYDFSYFNCPECDHKSQNKQDFVDHASFYHTKEFQIAQGTITDGSLCDVNIPVHHESPETINPEEFVKIECDVKDFNNRSS